MIKKWAERDNGGISLMGAVVKYCDELADAVNKILKHPSLSIPPIESTKEPTGWPDPGTVAETAPTTMTSDPDPFCLNGFKCEQITNAPDGRLPCAAISQVWIPAKDITRCPCPEKRRPRKNKYEAAAYEAAAKEIIRRQISNSDIPTIPEIADIIRKHLEEKCS